MGKASAFTVYAEGKPAWSQLWVGWVNKEDYNFEKFSCFSIYQGYAWNIPYFKISVEDTLQTTMSRTK